MSSGARPLRIWIAADFRSVHAIKWARWWHARGHEVTGFAFPGEDSPDLPFKINIVPWSDGAPGLQAIPAIAYYRRRLREESPDVVDVQGFTRHAIYLALLGARPLMLMLWGSDVLVGPRASRAQRVGLRFVVSRAEHTYATSREQVEVLRRIGAPVNRVDVRPYGIHVHDFPPRERPLAEPVVIHTRNFHPVYNVEQTVDAIPLVRKQVPEAKFILVGDGPLRIKMEARVRDLGVQDAVTFVGRVRYEDMRAWLAKARVYVSSSRSDTSSSSLLEALAVGLVPVVSDIPGNRGIVEPESHALLFPLDDPGATARQLVRALTDDALSDRLAVVGPKRVREVNGDFDKSMLEAERLYEAVARPSG